MHQIAAKQFFFSLLKFFETLLAVKNYQAAYKKIKTRPKYFNWAKNANNVAKTLNDLNNLIN